MSEFDIEKAIEEAPAPAPAKPKKKRVKKSSAERKLEETEKLLAEARQREDALKEENKDLKEERADNVDLDKLCKYIEHGAPECSDKQMPYCRIARCDKLQAYWAREGLDVNGNPAPKVRD